LSRQVNEYAEVGEALRLVLVHVRKTKRAELVPSVQSYGRVLAEDVKAPGDVPAASASHMDGFAVISADLEGASPSRAATLTVVGSTGPGDRSKHVLKSGETVQVATGAMLPPGADAVVPVELARTDGRWVQVDATIRKGEHVHGAGQDIRRGELVLREGRRIRAQDIGILLSIGRRKVRVWRRVGVAVIATGNELVPWDRPRKGKSMESHSHIFLRLAEAQGCRTVDLGIVRDDPKKLRATLGKAIARADFVLTLGGTSAGKRDFVVGAVSGLRPDALVHGLKLDRGRVTGLAAVKGKPILMLPGPIQAAANAFLVIGVPIIKTLSGSQEIGLSLPCVLGGPWEARKRFSDFQKVVYVRLRPGREAVAEPISGETESMKLLTDADGYFVVPQGVTKLEAGARVDVRLVPGFSST
jgi:molybdenum cofactor synthesis domain-containing protein